MKTSKEVIEDLLKSIHFNREQDITDVLRATRNASDYLRRIEREEKRYYDVTEAIRKYFQSVEDWKEENK
jgi:hypothetical protein